MPLMKAVIVFVCLTVVQVQLSAAISEDTNAGEESINLQKFQCM